LLREKIATIDNYDSKIIRVADSFGFICDISVEKYEEFKLKAEEIGISVRILGKLPSLFINPFADKYKIFQNIHSSDDQEKEINSTLEMLKK
jgi:hypothetical protein